MVAISGIFPVSLLRADPGLAASWRKAPSPAAGSRLNTDQCLRFDPVLAPTSILFARLLGSEVETNGGGS